MGKMSYKISLGLEATKVPDFMALWLEKDLPVDFTVKQRKFHGMRIIEVTVSGTDLKELQCKRMAFAKVVRSAGFRGIVVKDKKPIEI